jgi:hypothetical protein
MRAARHPAQPHLLAIVLVTLPPLSMAAESARSVRLPRPVFFNFAAAPVINEWSDGEWARHTFPEGDRIAPQRACAVSSTMMSSALAVS